MSNLNITMGRRAFVGAGLALAATLAGCGNSNASTSGSAAGSTAAAGDSYKVGVLQLTEHAALDAANDGFVQAIKDSGLDVDIDQQNAQNDQSACQTIASKFVSDNDNLIFAIGTPAAQAAAGATTDIPVVGTAITDFAASGLVASNDAPGGNVTGSSDLTPVAEQIDMLHKVLPDAKTIGILFASNESNSEIQVEMAEEACKKAGLEPVRYSVSSSNEIQSVAESMVGKVDAIYSPTDNTIAAGAAQVGQIARENKVPFIAGEEGMFTAGDALFTLSIDYEQLGYTAGEMAIKILKGEAQPADMAIETMPKDKLKTLKNEDVAKELGVDLSALDA